MPLVAHAAVVALPLRNTGERQIGPALHHCSTGLSSPRWHPALNPATQPHGRARPRWTPTAAAAYSHASPHVPSMWQPQP